MALGSFCLVLHGHLPYVLHHGRWPHGEDWLFEAAAETWLPLLGVLDTCAAEGLNVGWSVGMTPVLLEQLAHPTFASGFRRYLADARDQARADVAEFRQRGEGHLAWLAEREADHHQALLDQFGRANDDLVAAMKAHHEAGRVELMSSNATHGFHPLILHDACARAQVRAGLATSARHFGHTPRAVWVPECAYRPAGPWTPPVGGYGPRDGVGNATLYGAEGVRCFFVEHHLITGARPFASLDGDRVVSTSPRKDDGRAWCSWLEPHRVAERGVLTDVTVLGRAQDIAEQVWSASSGFPGDHRYREFHKRHGMRGLRYWRVTGRETDLGGKQPYDPGAASDAVRAHADHYAWMIADRLRQHQEHTGREGIVCAPFDAELFGHWWFEGPQFLLELARRLHHSEVQPRTVSAALEHRPADKAAELPAGTWGANGDSSVWDQHRTHPYWEAAYQAEDRFIGLWHRAAWRTDADQRALLTEAGRQLLLLQASDWPFVITTNGAPDYGWRRIHEHVGRFDDLCTGVEDLLSGAPLPPQAAASLAFCQSVDPVFPDLMLEWWA